MCEHRLPKEYPAVVLNLKPLRYWQCNRHRRLFLNQPLNESKVHMNYSICEASNSCPGLLICNLNASSGFFNYSCDS